MALAFLFREEETMLGFGPIGDTPLGALPDELLRAFDAGELPGVLVQAIVSLGEKTEEGQLVAALNPAWFEIIRLMEKDPSAMFAIPWRKWEEIIAGAYERSGFDRVTLTPRSGDLGRDVIAEKTGWGSVRFIDSVK